MSNTIVTEEIKKFDNYPEYGSDTLGNIYSFNYHRTGKIGKLSTRISNEGYELVSLHRYRKTFTVHRLIAKQYIANLDNKPCVNHKNGNKLDNRVDNLEWCTYQYNSQHAHDDLIKKGKHRPSYRVFTEEERERRKAYLRSYYRNVTIAKRKREKGVTS